VAFEAFFRAPSPSSINEFFEIHNTAVSYQKKEQAFTFQIL
jgi:hypothetical protein